MRWQRPARACGYVPSARDGGAGPDLTVSYRGARGPRGGAGTRLACDFAVRWSLRAARWHLAARAAALRPHRSPPRIVVVVVAFCCGLKWFAFLLWSWRFKCFLSFDGWRASGV